MSLTYAQEHCVQVDLQLAFKKLARLTRFLAQVFLSCTSFLHRIERSSVSRKLCTNLHELASEFDVSNLHSCTRFLLTFLERVSGVLVCQCVLRMDAILITVSTNRSV